MTPAYTTDTGQHGTMELLPCVACRVFSPTVYFLAAVALDISTDRALCPDCLEDLLEHAQSFDPTAHRQAILPSVVRRWLQLAGVHLEDL